MIKRILNNNGIQYIPHKKRDFKEFEGDLNDSVSYLSLFSGKNPKEDYLGLKKGS